LPLKILVIDDTALHRAVVEKFLVDRGHEVVLAKGGIEGMNRVETEAFDLVLLDYVMPPPGGLEVLVWMRRKFPKSQLPIFMLSANADTEKQQEAFNLGANSWQIKDGELKGLVEKIDELTIEKKS
jgi:CheY-like chemotaxis protein